MPVMVWVELLHACTMFGAAGRSVVTDGHKTRVMPQPTPTARRVNVMGEGMKKYHNHGSHV